MRPWIKLHTTMLDDVRLLRLNERQHLRYYQLYLLSGRLNADGLFVENGQRLDETDIAIKLRVSDRKQFITDFNALKKAGLIKQNGHGPYIEAFAREQVDWSKKQEQDRERKSKQRHGDVTRDTVVTHGKSRKGHSDVTPLDQTKTKTKIKKEKKKKIKTTTPQPPASNIAPKSAAGGGGIQESIFSDLKPEEQKTAEIIMPILLSSGIGKKKLIDTLPKVTTRIKPADAIRTTLAALASAYTDPDAKNPPMLALHRLSEGSVPPQFMISETWSTLPAAILTAANVDLARLPRARQDPNQDVIKKVAANVR
jgi:hypothetical protein